MEREARHAPAHAGHQPKQAWNTLPVGLPVNSQLDLASTSNHTSTGRLPYSFSGRGYVYVVCFLALHGSGPFRAVSDVFQHLFSAHKTYAIRSAVTFKVFDELCGGELHTEMLA